MTIKTRQYILRANALFLLIASAGGFIADIVAVNTLAGPMGRVIADAPHSAIGLIEAHGLAFILGVLLWRAEPSRAWHLTAAAIHLLLGTAIWCSGRSLFHGDVSGCGLRLNRIAWAYSFCLSFWPPLHPEPLIKAGNTHA